MSPQVFSHWPANLPHNVEMMAVSAPGHGARWQETALADIDELVCILSDAIGGYIDKPFVFLGHSMGALICYELSRKVRRKYGVLPQELFVVACSAPDVPGSLSIAHLPDSEFLIEVNKLGGVADEILNNQQLIQLLLPTLRADALLTENYRYQPEPPLPCSVTVYAGIDDPLAPPSLVGCWSKHTTRRFAFHVFPGGHFFLGSSEPDFLRSLSNELLRISEEI